MISDLVENPSMPTIQMDIASPLIAADQVIGFVILRIDPVKFLYPLIQAWPTPSPSAETLLVRREGDDVLFLNELRHRKGTALKLRLPLRTPGLPAAMAASGKTGAALGRDYRGVAVWSVSRPVAGTSWFIVAKIDREEIELPIRRNALWMSLIVLSLVLATAITLISLWQRQIARFRLRQLESERQQRALVQHFDYLTRYANDIILLSDEKWNILEANERALVTYGFNREALLKRSLRDLCAPKERDRLAGEYKRAEERLGLIFETVHQKKDGAIFPVEVSARVIDIEGKKYFQSIVRDISERKRTEEALRETEAKFRQTFELSPVGIVMVGLDKRFLRCNKAFSGSLGYAPEELIGKTIADITYPDDVHFGMDEMKPLPGVNWPSLRFKHSTFIKVADHLGKTTISLIRDQKANPHIHGNYPGHHRTKTGRGNHSPERGPPAHHPRCHTVPGGHRRPAGRQDRLLEPQRPCPFRAYSAHSSGMVSARLPRSRIPAPGDRALETLPGDGARDRPAVNTGEYRVTCRDGSVRICELHATFLEKNLIVTFNDISERKRAEEALHETEIKTESCSKTRSRSDRSNRTAVPS